MNKQEIRNLIKEEIKKVLHEQRIDPELQNYLIDKVDWNRKCSTFNEVHAVFDVYDVPDEIHDKIIVDIGLYTITELWDVEDMYDVDLSDAFEIEVPQFFIVDTPKGSYLINTEGYDYARYITKVLNM